VDNTYAPTSAGGGSAAPPFEAMQGLPDLTSPHFASTPIGAAAAHAAAVLPGPFDGVGSQYEHKYEIIKELMWAEAAGTNHLLWNEWQTR
jgi:hypothetical protein